MIEDKKVKPYDTVSEFVTRPVHPAPVRDVRDNFKKVLEDTKDTTFVLTKHGKPQGVLLDYKLFEHIQGIFRQMVKQQFKERFKANEQNIFNQQSDVTQEYSEEDIAQLVESIVKQDRQERGLEVD